LLSADDWEKVIGFGCPGAYAERWQHSPRLILEGILAKLVSGEPWRKLSYPAGDWRNVSTTYRKWKTSGVWEEVCRRLMAAKQPVLPLGG
jgi:transposase